MTEKTAVILMNLGGPLQKKDVAPFLYNFFMDKNILPAPLPLRWLLAKWIAFSRSRGAAKSAYSRLGYKSPLLENTQAQAKMLEEKLGDNFKVFISMRYWHPLAAETVRDVEAWDPDHIVLLPLYPQYSTTTTKSSFEDFTAKVKAKEKVRQVACYPLLPGFIRASAEKIAEALRTAPAKTRVLFSAHGLPEKVILAGDPYQSQCEASAAAIAKEAGLADWQICYQSRLGPLKWIGPSTEEALARAAKDRVGVAIYPHAFVSEHAETLVEIDMEYREKAKRLGIPWFAKAETVGTHPAFIGGLAELVLDCLKGQNGAECAKEPGHAGNRHQFHH